MQGAGSVQLVEQLQQSDDLPPGTEPATNPAWSHPDGLGSFLVPHTQRPGSTAARCRFVGRKERKGIVQPNRTLTTIQQFAKISFAMPTFGVGDGFQAVVLDPPVPRIESLDS